MLYLNEKRTIQIAPNPNLVTCSEEQANDHLTYDLTAWLRYLGQKLPHAQRSALGHYRGCVNSRFEWRVCEDILQKWSYEVWACWGEFSSNTFYSVLFGTFYGIVFTIYTTYVLTAAEAYGLFSSAEGRFSGGTWGWHGRQLRGSSSSGAICRRQLAIIWQFHSLEFDILRRCATVSLLF
jgi:hypothetical protein